MQVGTLFALSHESGLRPDLRSRLLDQIRDGTLRVRTDPSAPKHRGISYLLADMKTPGITVRPLVLMNGHRHFNEVFFVDVRVPKENLIGRQNEGWKPAMTTLMYER